MADLDGAELVVERQRGKGKNGDQGGEGEAAEDHLNNSSETGFGPGVEPGSHLGEGGGAGEDGGLAVAVDHHRARQFACPGRVDLVTQAFVEAVGEAKTLAAAEAGLL